MKSATKPAAPNSVYGQRLPAPRLTLWGPFLLACLLSLLVLLAMGLRALF